MGTRRSDRYTVREALLNPRLLALSAIYFGIIAANVGLGFFLPQIVQTFGMSNFRTSLVSALPYVVGLVGIVLWGRRSDRKQERQYHTAFPWPSRAARSLFQQSLTTRRQK